jgi:hypothetical protein
MNYNLTMLNVHIKSCFCSTTNLLKTAFISALKITQTRGLRCDPPKPRYENHTNKKTLKQA